MARIALIGATGNVGSRLLDELVSRGHQVTAIGRDPAKVAARPGVNAARADIHDKAGLAAVLRGHDAVISAGKDSGRYLIPTSYCVPVVGSTPGLGGATDSA